MSDQALHCSFCDKGSNKVPMFARNKVFICMTCIDRCQEAPSELIPMAAWSTRCSFCEKKRQDVQQMFKLGYVHDNGRVPDERESGAITICSECVLFCNELVHASQEEANTLKRQAEAIQVLRMPIIEFLKRHMEGRALDSLTVGAFARALQRAMQKHGLFSVDDALLRWIQEEYRSSAASNVDDLRREVDIDHGKVD